MKSRLLMILLVFTASMPASGGYRCKAQRASAHTAVTPAGKHCTAAGTNPASSLRNSVLQLMHLREGDDEKEVNSNTNGKLSMIFGILGILTFPLLGGVVFGIPAMILGKVARENDEQFARVGRILGIVALSLTCLAAFFLVVIYGG